MKMKFCNCHEYYRHPTNLGAHCQLPHRRICCLLRSLTTKTPSISPPSSPKLMPPAIARQRIIREASLKPDNLVCHRKQSICSMPSLSIRICPEGSTLQVSARKLAPPPRAVAVGKGRQSGRRPLIRKHMLLAVPGDYVCQSTITL